jgi:lipopolysaccharide export LptBFGC system permease protein LptF
MVFTIHRYIFRELLRIFVLAAVALALTVVPCMLVGPIQKFGVGPKQVVHLLGYFIPIILTFVLPMAALFAAALTYGRFAFDNELDACRASGISLMTLIYPGLCLSIIVAIVTLILSFHVVPAFVHRAEKAIQGNVKQILFRNIQRKGFYTLPDNDFRIYADQADPAEDALGGVVVIESEGANITKLITAKAAKIVFDDIGKLYNKVTVVAREAYQIDEEGYQVYSRQLPVSGRFESLLADSIKFQKIEQIKKIKVDMLNFNPILKLALGARAQLAAELLAAQITETISGEGTGYYQLIAEDRIVMFSAGRCEAKAPESQKKSGGKPPTIELSYEVKLSEYDKIRQELILHWESARGILRFEDNQVGSPLEIVLYNPVWQRSDGLRRLAQQHVIRNVAVPEAVEEILAGDNLLEKLLDVRSILPTASKGLIGLQEELKGKIQRTANEISSEIHSRLVLGLGCTTLVLIAAALGIIFKGGHLLSAFGTSAIPAAVLVIFILAGKELTKNPAVPAKVGIMVMWSGLIVLSVLTVALYHKLLKT